MSVDTLLSRLQGVKKTGAERWIARCSAHEDKHASLSIALSQNNRDVVLLRCHALCSTEDVLAAVGLTFEDLYPERAIDNRIAPQRRPFFPSEVFEVARMEVGICAVIAADMHKNREISEADYQRLYVAVERLQGIAGAAYGR